MLVVVGLVAVGLGHERADGHGGLYVGVAPQVLEDRVEVSRVGAVEGDEGVAPAAHGVEGALPVDVTQQGVDLAVVREHAHRLREGPLGHGVGREAPVVDCEVGEVARVLQVLVEGSQHGALRHALVHDGARGEGGDVRLTQALAAARLDALLDVGLDRAARLVEQRLELVAARAGVVDEALLDVGQRRERHRAEHLLPLRHSAPAEHLEAAPLRLRREEALDLLGLGGVGGQEGHRDAARVGGVALQVPVRLEELPRHRRQHARAITGHGVTAAAAAVLHATQRDQRAGHDVVPPPALLIG